MACYSEQKKSRRFNRDESPSVFENSTERVDEEKDLQKFAFKRQLSDTRVREHYAEYPEVKAVYSWE